ncbi:hypothetical protein KEM54_004486, partial [Ascosphaera aggregata]
MATAATASESPTPFPRYHRSGSRASLVAAAGSFAPDGSANYHRTASRQSFSRTSGGYERLSGGSRSLSGTRESPSQSSREHHDVSRPMSAMAASYAAAREAGIRRPISTGNTSHENRYYYQYANDDDSSDDDVPEPIKFSASVRALLEEDGAADPAELRSSPLSATRSG